MEENDAKLAQKLQKYWGSVKESGRNFFYAKPAMLIFIP